MTLTETLIAAAGVITTATASLIVDWMKSDAQLTSLPRALDDAAKTFQILESAARIAQQIEALPAGRLKEEAQRSAEVVLSQIRTKVEAAATNVPVVSTGRRARSLVIRVADFLALGKPKHLLLWIPQLVFYAAFIMFFLLARRPNISLLDPLPLGLAVVGFAAWGTRQVFNLRKGQPE
jgi:hypothetical protein